MLFMTKMFILVGCLCATIQFNQAQPPTTLLTCTFDKEDKDCGFRQRDTDKPLVLYDPNDESFDPINKPFSDVTAATSPTANNETCLNNSVPSAPTLNFCRKLANESVYNCDTKNGGRQNCTTGSYAYLSLRNMTNEVYISNSTENATISGFQCLTFYYYFTLNQTNASLEISWEDAGSSQNNGSIVTVYPQSENKWYRDQTQFNISTSSFQIVLTLTSNLVYNESYAAIDSFTIIEGECPNETPSTTTPIPPTADASETTGSNTDDTSHTTTPSDTDGSTSSTTTETITTTSSTTKSSSRATVKTTTKKNFGCTHGLSLALGTLTMMIYSTIIV